MPRRATSVMLNPEERTLLRTVAGMYDVSLGEYVRVVMLKHARRVLKSPQNKPPIYRYTIDEQQPDKSD